ncbi:PAS domain S-box protein [Pseudomonas benzenivorans]|uniref:histidine kinase n=1 Tax=Pseudomonas benzenivorans TaxID=556533 RepID=A0ABY5H1H8_9PSED|nr:PAS domain S-box protein [Pseudomonas benzenivorans]UTW06120.1 PAS domain S-box protein [Pseudomonas benzenivorans]
MSPFLPGAPLPLDEAARLAELERYALLDSPAEEAFDDLTLLAAQLCEVPIALISLVDAERQWFKSRVGLDACETPRESAFCAHAILSPTLMEVPDALADPRFRDNPLVTGPPHIRFYAGMPLTTRSGHRLGTLCVIDQRPRQLNPGQREGLQRLARQVQRQFELRLSARQHAEQAALQRAILDSAGSAMITTCPAGRITSINPAAEQLLGYNRQQLLDRSLAATLLDPQELASRAQALGQRLGRGGPADFSLLISEAEEHGGAPGEWTYLRRDGSRLPVLLTVSAIRDEAGALLGHVTIAQDLSQRVQAQQRLQQIAAQLPGMVFQAQLPAQGTVRFPYASEGIADIYGLSPADVLEQSKAVFAVIHEDDRAAVSASVLDSARQLHQWHQEYRVRHPRKGLIWVEGTATPQRQADGSVIWHGVISDISARKQQQAELEQQQEMNRRLLEALAVGVVACDAQGRLTLFNDTARQWHGTDISQLPSEQWSEHYDLFQADGQTPLSSDNIPLLCALRGERVRAAPISIVAKGQAPRLVSVNADPLYAPDGRQLGAVAVMHDITEHKRIERLQREFVSAVSHELRTPLTSIAGSLGLIQGGALGELPAEMQQMLEIAHHNSLRLTQLINDLLDMDKLVAGKMTLDLQCLDLPALLADSLVSNQAFADQHGVLLAAGPCPPIEVRADAMRLQQVLANFLSNAIKFSPRGAVVQLTAALHGARIRVSVADQGAGVPEAFRERIFQKFAQADAADSRQKGGTGLGLAISKELIERMGGRIGFDSTAGQGATFWFELALPAPAGADEGPWMLLVEDRAQVAPLLQGLPARSRVLHVEDDADLRQVIAEQARALAEFISAGSLVQARQRLAEGHYDLVLLDLGLPDGSGLELLEELNRHHPGLPVVVLSAQELPADQRDRVAAVLAKSRTNGQHFLQLLGRLLPAKENRHA